MHICIGKVTRKRTGNLNKFCPAVVWSKPYMPLGGKGGETNFARESDQRSTKGHPSRDGAPVYKTLCLLCRGTEKPKAQSCIQNQAQMALLLPMPQFWRHKIATFALQYYKHLQTHFPVWTALQNIKTQSSPWAHRWWPIIFPLQCLGYVQLHLFHKHLFNQPGHMFLVKVYVSSLQKSLLNLF